MKNITLKTLLLLAPLTCQAGVDMDLGKNGQWINIMGADMERSADFLQKAKNTGNVINWVFKDAKNVDILRVKYDKEQEPELGETDLSIYDEQIKSMQQIKNAHPAVKFWGTLLSDYDGYGSNNNLPDHIYTGRGYNGGSYSPSLLNDNRYANFLTDYLEYMHDNDVTISYLSIGKEWTAVIDATREKKVIDRIKNKCNARGIPIPKFIGPATWGTGGGNSFLKTVDDKNWQGRYSGFCTHDYDFPSLSTRKTFVDRASAMGKSAYNDEVNIGAGGPTSGAEPDIGTPISAFERKAAMYEAGFKGEIGFEHWSRGINRETRAIYFRNGQNGNRLRGYYLYRDFTGTTAWSNYHASTVTSNLSDMTTMVFRKGKEVTLWVMNDSNSTRWNVSFAIQGKTFNRGKKVTHKTWRNSTSIAGSSTTFEEKNNTSFVRTIQPKSVNRFTFTIN